MIDPSAPLGCAGVKGSGVEIGAAAAFSGEVA